MAEQGNQTDGRSKEAGISTLALAASIRQDDNTSFKVAWMAAILIHFSLFLVVFPDLSGTEAVQEQRDAVVIKRYKPHEPPKQQPEKKVVKKKTARVPIPDPTQMIPSRS